ncbi:hypothetical protein SNE40_005723 [Patella caerulea]
MNISSKDLESRIVGENASESLSAIEDLLKLIDVIGDEVLSKSGPTRPTQVEAQSVTLALSRFLHFSGSSEQILGQKELNDLKKYARETVFPRCFEAALKNVSVEANNKLNPSDKHRFNELLFNLVKQGPSFQVFMVLNTVLINSCAGFSQMKFISLMESFIGEKLQSLFLEQCLVEKISTNKEFDQKQNYVEWEELISALSSFPDRIAGKLQNHNNSDKFLPKNYIELLGNTIIIVLEEVHGLLTSDQDCSLEFISRLIGKLCLSGYADILWSSMIRRLCVFVKQNYIWCRICERIVTRVPDKCIESVIVPLLQKIPWYGLVDKFLGDSILTNRKIHFLLCTKLLFHRYFDETQLVRNILGYLASSHTRRMLYLETMENLLSVWGDGSAIKHTSYSQHLFISRALMICIGYLSDKEKSMLKDEFLRILMPAVQCHIGSSDIKLRNLGMVVAETLTTTLDPKGPKLQFEFEKDEEVYDLLSYLEVPEDTSTQTQEEITRSENKDIEQGTCKTTHNPTNLTDDQNTKHNIQTEIELDSDDDLEPYDMSNDVKKTKVKNPKYIRDCMEGLICSDDAEKVEACLFNAEALIRKSPDGLKEIAAEFSKILLHLQDNFSSHGFDAIRFGAMVALAVECPVEVAGYLSSQFYERNYNLRQRMNILEVLSAAAQELAKPVDKSRVRQPKPVEEIKPSKESDDWREIVEKRIEGKTRRFIKGRTQPEPAQVANRFAPVAGHFFFPLLKHFDRSQASFDLLGEETVVLRKLIFSLGIILYSALHAPLATRMCVNLLEFIWVLRYHSDSCIRQALLYATSMIILVLPPFGILTDLQDVMLETKSWLQETIDKDKDTECKRMALQALMLFENTIQKGFKLSLNDAGK